jgi:sirohydrochlorin ferrochelatase
VLLAHGSRRSRNSASAAEQTASKARAHRLFADVRVSFLDEPPSLEKAVSEISGPVAIVGLFSGDGLHGGNDATRLMAQLDRKDAIYVGNVGSFPGLEKLIATAVDSAITDQPMGV